MSSRPSRLLRLSGSVFAASLLASISGCSSSSGGSPTPTGKDAAADTGHPAPDAGHDATQPSHDAGAPDATTHVSSEAGPDAPAPKDASHPDASITEDATPEDATPEDATGAVDAAVDSGKDAGSSPPMCPPSCPDGHACTSASQCASGVCTAGACASPSCAPDCTNGKACGANGDCLWSYCNGTMCESVANCASLLAVNPSAPSGQYQISPPGTDGGSVTFIAYCDMTTAGGGWTQVVDQNIGVTPGYQSLMDWRNGVNVTQPNSGQYSILYNLPVLKNGTNYELLITWPTAPEAGSIQWTQVENPLIAPETPTISNVVMLPAGLTQTGCGSFRGLGPSLKGQPSALNGDSANDSACWWWGIGTSSPYVGGIPSYDNGPQGNVGTSHAQLWVR